MRLRNGNLPAGVNVLETNLNTGIVTTTKIGSSAVTYAKLDESLIKIADVVISSAELLALYGTPKELVAAPGANKALIFLGAELKYVYVTGAYTISNTNKDLSIRYTDGSGNKVCADIETTGAASGAIGLDQSADVKAYVNPSAAYGPVANAALVAQILNADVTAGGGHIHVRTYYRVVPTNE